MPISLRGFFTRIFDFIAAARVSEYRIRSLTVGDLRDIARRKKDRAYGATIHTLLPYKDRTVRALVLEMKYHRTTHALALAQTLLAEELFGLQEEYLEEALLIPVPMHAARRKVRGYNQIELLCEATLAANPLLTLSYSPQALMRMRSGAPQQTLARSARLKNMHRAITAGELVRGRRCIVIDDVTTTGATLSECRRALVEASARSVYLIALAG